MLQAEEIENKMSNKLTNMIAIMQSYQQRKCAIEEREIGVDEWKLVETPLWNFEKYEYRIPPSYRKKMETMLNEHDLPQVSISFGCVEDFSDGSKKILFDTKFRNHLARELEIGDVTKFYIIPFSMKSKKAIENYNKED